ncbi:MAG TPA: tetratricopeptide repeat protein [Terriglobales bacterium]|nr:tetratricopeptide repeat protein [Terriglobales bacterium]
MPRMGVGLTLALLVGWTAVVSGQSSVQSSGSAAPAQSAEAQGSGPLAHARDLMEHGKNDQAIVELLRLEATSPEHKGLAHELGVAYYKKSNFPKAIEYLKKAVEQDAADSEGTQLLGLSYYLSGRPSEAIPYLEKVQGWYPRANVDAAYILGVSYLQNKNYPMARKAFARMFDLPPDSAASYLFTARMLLRQEFQPIAEEYAQKAVALDPKLPLAHFLLGELYMFKSQIPEAIGEFQKEMAINPAHAATYYKLADAYSRVQKYDDAERLLQRSIWLDSTASGPYVLMAKVLLKKGEPELSARAAQRALSMDSNNYVAHYLLGQAYQVLGNSAAADNEFKISQQLQAKQTHSAEELSK